MLILSQILSMVSLYLCCCFVGPLEAVYSFDIVLSLKRIVPRGCKPINVCLDL